MPQASFAVGIAHLDDERIGLAIFGLESELVLIIAPGWIAIVGYDLRLMLHWPHSQLDERVTLGAWISQIVTGENLNVDNAD